MPQDKKQTKLIVKEVKSLSPLSEVYELNKYSRYLVSVPKSDLVGGYEVAHERARIIAQAFQKLGIPCVIMIGVGEGVEFMELEAVKI